MKRSTTLTLLLMGTATIALCACDSDIPSDAYTSVGECVAAKVYSPQDCQTSYDKARAASTSVAPKYDDLADCERDYGPKRCEAGGQQSGHMSFMPFMMGYLMGRHSDNGYVAPQPLYRSWDSDRRASGAFFTAGGHYIGETTGHVSVSPRAGSAPRAFTTTIARGGFGGGFHGGFGG